MTKYERAHILNMQSAYQEQRDKSVNDERHYRYLESIEQDRFIRSLTTEPNKQGDGHE